MDTTIEKILEAHVRHELNRFKPRAVSQTIREETAALFQWIEKTTLREIITPEQIVGVMARNVVERPIAPKIRELAVEMSQRVHLSPQNKITNLKDILPRNLYNESAARIGGMEKAREDLINYLVNSSVYAQQISEVLFTGIKEYLLVENIFAQKVPGLASLIKLGKFAVNKTMQPLEAAVEKTVKSYIENNLGNTIRRSEKSLNAYFTEAHIIEMADEIWNLTSKKKLSEYYRMVEAEDLETFVAIGYEFWLHFRKTDYFKAIYTDLVYFFFEKYGDRELRLLADDMGVTEEMVIDELMQILPHGIKKAMASGYLEARIRSRLENFYLSPETAKLFALKGKKPQKTTTPAKKTAKKPSLEKKTA